jgi:hypothetical protein
LTAAGNDATFDHRSPHTDAHVIGSSIVDKQHQQYK